MAVARYGRQEESALPTLAAGNHSIFISWNKFLIR